MNISYSLQSSLDLAFMVSSYLLGENISTSDKFILARCINGNYIIPTIYYNLYNRYIGNHIQSSYEGLNIVAILPQPLRNEVYKTSDSVIKHLFKYSGNNYNTSFKCVDTGKGYKYYGGKGIILDGDCRPLMICGYESKITNNNIVDSKRVCLISPDVYIREDMVSKCIVRKIIPYYSACNAEIKIIISHSINEFIRVPASPNSNNVDEELYDILSHNMT